MGGRRGWMSEREAEWEGQMRGRGRKWWVGEKEDDKCKREREKVERVGDREKR